MVTIVNTILDTENLLERVYFRCTHHRKKEKANCGRFVN